MSNNLGLSDIEYRERETLLEYQKDKQRWFSQDEFDRLRNLNLKILEIQRNQIISIVNEFKKIESVDLDAFIVKKTDDINTIGITDSIDENYLKGICEQYFLLKSITLASENLHKLIN